MKIIHTIPGIGASNGGTSSSVYELLTALQDTDVDASLVSLRSRLGDDLCEGKDWGILLDNDAILPILYSKKLKSYLASSTPDIIHTNCLWSYCNHISAKIAREKGIPLIHTPHGMLFADAIKRRYWKKWPLIQLWVKNDVKHTDCMHATCKFEMENIRKFGYTGAIAVIPNAMPPIENSDKIIENHKVRRIGFLGRLHPVKCVDRLIEAWKILGKKADDTELVLIGEGEDEYVTYLKDLASSCKYGKISFRGFATGLEKYQELATLRALCLVSVYENFGMVVSEALSVGTPVLANTTTPWEDLNTYNCGWWLDATPTNIAETLATILELSDSEIKAMSDNGKKLVAEKYSSEKVGEMMANLYKWIANGGDKPEYVYTVNNLDC